MNTQQRPSVLLISVDALKPEFLLEQKRLGLELPNLTRCFLQGGAVAKGGVKSVFPTFTYPCHQSIITGATPAVHGIYNNAIFDPAGKHMGAWNWFANKNVKTLWQAAREGGYCSASVAFPTSVGADGDYIAPEFWWDGSVLDSAFLDVMCRPQGLIAEMEADIGRYAGGLDLTDAGDAQRGAAALWMLRNKLEPQIAEKPFFLSAYFASFDESAHLFGVYSPEVAASLQKIDAMVGSLIDEARRICNGNVYVCVVSDHGSLDNTHNISPNVLLRQAGLIQIDDEGRVLDWKAWSQRAGGTAEIRLADPDDADTRAKVEKLLADLLADPDSGILEVLNHEQALERGGFALADYVLVSRKGYELRDDVSGAYCRTTLHQKAQHGYSENFPEMRASVLIAGPGIAPGTDLGSMNLIDIAPTLAHLMGVSLPDAQGQSRLS